MLRRLVVTPGCQIGLDHNSCHFWCSAMSFSAAGAAAKPCTSPRGGARRHNPNFLYLFFPLTNKTIYRCGEEMKRVLVPSNQSCSRTDTRTLPPQKNPKLIPLTPRSNQTTHVDPIRDDTVSGSARVPLTRDGPCNPPPRRSLTRSPRVPDDTAAFPRSSSQV